MSSSQCYSEPIQPNFPVTSIQSDLELPLKRVQQLSLHGFAPLCCNMHFRARACALLFRLAPPLCAAVPCLLKAGACTARQFGGFIFRSEVSFRGSILVTYYVKFCVKMADNDDAVYSKVWYLNL